MDEIVNLFRKTQYDEGMQLAAESDLLELQSLDDRRYIAVFSCTGLVRDASGNVRKHDQFGVGIQFPDNYLRLANPGEILTWLGPKEIWHPNIRAPLICLGNIVPGTPLVDLLHRCFEVITFENVTMSENDALNAPACAWARRHRDLFPIDTLPIKRRRLPAHVEAAEATP